MDLKDLLDLMDLLDLKDLDLEALKYHLNLNPVNLDMCLDYPECGVYFELCYGRHYVIFVNAVDPESVVDLVCSVAGFPVEYLVVEPLVVFPGSVVRVSFQGSSRV